MTKHINIDELFLRLWNGDYDKSYEKTLEETKQALYDLMLEMIGKDVFPPHQNEWHGENEARIIGGDDLRAELRAKLKQYFGKDE